MGVARAPLDPSPRANTVCGESGCCMLVAGVHKSVRGSRALVQELRCVPQRALWPCDRLCAHRIDFKISFARAHKFMKIIPHTNIARGHLPLNSIPY